MKRFYCTVCKKVKRVRKLPIIMNGDWDSVFVTDRTGECNWHSMGFHPRPVKKPYERPVKVKPIVQSNKASRKRAS